MRKYKDARNRAFDAVVTLILLIMGLACFLPLMHVVALSFSSKNAALSGYVRFLPVEFTSTPYRFLLTDERFWQAALVSVQRVLLGGAINLVLTVFAAFSLSQEKEHFPGRNIYMWIIVFAMLFGASMVPWYFVINKTGLLDSIWALVLPGALPIYSTILLMNFYRNEPKAIKESALIDGVNPLQMLLRIYIPLAMPALATITLFSVVNHWNNFFDGLLLMNSPDKVPLQTYIFTLSNTNIQVTTSNMTPEELEALSSQRTFNAAKVVVATIPILLIYPFMQRYVVSGITLGSVKE